MMLFILHRDMGLSVHQATASEWGLQGRGLA